jgi:hypothetical protein
MKKNFLLTYIYIGFIGIAAFILMLWITPFGSGVSADSTIYIGGAKSLLSGKGFSINGSPITHFPPLYSLFLAAASLLENDIIQASHFLNAIIFGINAGLVALAVYLATERNYLASGFAVLFFLSSTLLLEVHSWAWSEPLFITFSLACIILLSMYTIRPTISLLIPSSIFLGFALATRYAGAAFLPAALVIVFVSGSGQHIGRRFRNILIWSIVACAPLGISLARNTIIAGSATNRSLVFHPVSVYQYSRGFASGVTNFFVPISLPDGVKLAFFGLLVFSLIALLVTLFKRHRGVIYWRRMDIGMSASSLLFFFFYMLFLFISISFMDASTSINPRLLSPILVILNVGLFSTMWAITQILKKPVVWRGFLLFIALSILIKTPDAIQSATAIQKNGLGYTALQWQESESIAFIRSLANNVDIYSNGTDILSFLTGNQSLPIPRKTNSTTMMANLHYDEEIKVMCEDIVENKALLVYFNQITWRWYLPSQAEIESTCHLPVLQHFADGTVYGEK